MSIHLTTTKKLSQCYSLQTSNFTQHSKQVACTVITLALSVCQRHVCSCKQWKWLYGLSVFGVSTVVKVSLHAVIFQSSNINIEINNQVIKETIKIFLILASLHHYMVNYDFYFTLANVPFFQNHLKVNARKINC